MNISAWAVKNPVPVILLFIILTMLGLIGFQRLPIQSFVEDDMPIVYINASLEGMAPAQLEAELARKIEDVVSTLAGLEHINSTITDGAVMIMVQFSIGKDPETALNEVRNAVDSVRSDLPGELAALSVSKETTDDNILAVYTLSSAKMNEAELSWFADNELSKALLSARGVGQIERVGGIEREIHIELEHGLMSALGLTALDVSEALRAAQADFSGGQGEVAGGRQSVRTAISADRPEKLADLYIPLPSGAPVRLGDIAELRDSYASRSSLAYLDGEPVIALQIKRAKGYSDLDVLERLNRAMDEFAKKYPEVEVRQAYNSTGPTIETYESSMQMLYEGAFLAVIVVFLFLRNIRATGIAAISLPMSIIPAFFIMFLAGFSLNSISLLALSLVVGILVDDSIVEVENIARHSGLGKTPQEAAIEATQEIGMAVVATTLTLVCVFLPTAFMGGIAGLVFRQFGISASAAIIASLLVARLLTPVMAAEWMKPTAQKEEDGKIMRLYLAFAQKCLHHRKSTIAAVFLFMAASLALTDLLGTDFLTATDESRTNVVITLQPGSSLEDTAAMAQKAAAIIMAHDEVVSVFTSVGTAAGGEHESDLASFASATLTTTLTPLGRRAKSQGDIENELKSALAALPGVRVQVGGGSGTMLDITLSGDDPLLLEEVAAALESELRHLKGVGGVTSSASSEAPEIRIEPDSLQAAAYGISAGDIARAVRSATSGDYSFNLPKLNLPERQLPIRIKYADAVKHSLEDIGRIMVPSSKGQVALEAVAEIYISGSPAMITRVDRERNITLSVELNGRSMGEVMNEAMALPAFRNMPPEVHLAEQGDIESMNEMFSGFAMAMAIGLFCVYAVLVLLFRDFLQPITILMAIPLAIGGGLFPLAVTGTSFSLSGAIAFLMLMGIVTKNSILLVEYAIMARGRGLDRMEALMDACHKRARPIVMTTVAMIGGMLPVIIGLAGGDPSFRRPMATVVVGGLLSSTCLSLVVIPVIYTLVDDISAKVFGKRVKPLRPSVHLSTP